MFAQLALVPSDHKIMRHKHHLQVLCSSILLHAVVHAVLHTALASHLLRVWLGTRQVREPMAEVKGHIPRFGTWLQKKWRSTPRSTKSTVWRVPVSMLARGRDHRRVRTSQTTPVAMAALPFSGTREVQAIENSTCFSSACMAASGQHEYSSHVM